MKMSIDTEKFKASMNRRKQMEDIWRVNYQNTELYKGLQDARLGTMHINQNTCFLKNKKLYTITTRSPVPSTVIVPKTLNLYFIHLEHFYYMYS